MGRQSIWEYLRSVYARYRQAAREVKRKILDEFCANTKYNRKYALRLLNGPPPRSGAASARSPSATAAHLQQGVGIGAEGHLAGGGLSLVGAAEGPDPVVDALGAKAFSPQRRGRAPTAGHQRPPNRPPAAPLQSLRPATPLRWHPAGSPAEASHPPAGRSLGCPRTRFHGSGPGGALGQLGGGRVRLHLECYRRLQRLDGVASGVGARPGGGRR